MARFTRLQVYNQMQETGIIPLFYHADAEVCFNVVQACYSGGSRVFEFTNRGDLAHEVFTSLVKTCQKKLPDLILGVGSVIDGPTASLYMQLGANFIVSPVLKEDMPPICHRRKVAWIPGCGSVTEISKAEEFGAEIVKIFPGSQVGGPEFVKSVLGPMPWTSIMPSGGVKPEEENIKKWFEAGAFCLGMGSQLMVKEKDGRYNYPEIERLMRFSIDCALKHKKKHS